MRSYYDVLGVPRNATTDQIKEAYRKLAKKYHPDSGDGSDGSKRRFQEIQEAYAVLSDPEKRRMYHSYGHEAFTQSYAAQHGRNYQWDAPEDEGCGGDCGDGCGEGCGDGCEKHGHSHKKKTVFYHEVRVGVHMEMEETFHETEKEVVFVEQIYPTDPAPDWKAGSGSPRFREQEWKIRVRIPYGAYDKQLLPLRDVIVDGDELLAHLAKEHPDNYYNVIILLDDKKGYRRQGYHLFTTIPVDYCTLVLGGTVQLPTLHGPEPYELSPGTSPYQYVRLPGRGLIYPPEIGKRGDLHVYLNLEIPTDLTPAQAEAVRHLQEVMQASQEGSIT